MCLRKSDEELKKMLSNDSNSYNRPLLLRFAFMGKDDEYYDELSRLAEKEIWSIPGGGKFGILKNYITYTFDKVFNERNIFFSGDADGNDEFCCFNTGLLTTNGEDVICIFNRFKNSKQFFWHIMGFRQESHRDIMNNFNQTPPVAKYFSDPSDAYFDPNVEMLSNIDHIIDDNFNRFSDDLRKKGKDYIVVLLKASLEVTRKKCKRNYRIAVPQFYKNKIMYLLPINLDGTNMALAVEKINQRYRANTIFTIEMAYKNARLLMKPEADWLELK